MSDYISKSALLDSLIYCDGLGRKSLEAVVKTINALPTVDEKEIIRKPFERVVKRLNKKQSEFRQARHDLSLAMYTDEKAYNKARILTQKELVINEAKQIVKEEGGISD